MTFQKYLESLESQKYLKCYNIHDFSIPTNALAYVAEANVYASESKFAIFTGWEKLMYFVNATIFETCL